MTQEELNYIKDAFSQIIDDISGNPDWHEAARAIASDLGTLERKLEEKVSPLPSNLDEAAENRVTENGRFEITQFEKMRIEDIKLEQSGWRDSFRRLKEIWLIGMKQKVLIIVAELRPRMPLKCRKDFTLGRSNTL